MWLARPKPFSKHVPLTVQFEQLQVVTVLEMVRRCSLHQLNPQENSPSGLWRQLGKLVGCKPSGVRILLVHDQRHHGDSGL